MNKLLFELLNRDIDKLLQKNPEKLKASLLSKLPEDLSEELSETLIDIFHSSVRTSICLTLDTLDKAGYIELPKDDNVLRRKFLHVLDT